MDFVLIFIVVAAVVNCWVSYRNLKTAMYNLEQVRNNIEARRALDNITGEDYE